MVRLLNFCLRKQYIFHPTSKKGSFSILDKRHQFEYSKEPQNKALSSLETGAGIVLLLIHAR